MNFNDYVIRSRSRYLLKNELLKKIKIQIRCLIPIHKQKTHLNFCKDVRLPLITKVPVEILSLPVYLFLKDDEVINSGVIEVASS